MGHVKWLLVTETRRYMFDGSLRTISTWLVLPLTPLRQGSVDKKSAVRGIHDLDSQVCIYDDSLKLETYLELQLEV